MGAKVLQFRPKGRRFRDLTIVGEGPEDVRKIEDQKAMSQASRDAHEAASKLAHEADEKLPASTPIHAGQPMTPERRAANKEAARRGGILSRALRKLAALAEYKEINRRASKSRTMPREYVLSAEEQALVDDYRKRKGTLRDA